MTTAQRDALRSLLPRPTPGPWRFGMSEGGMRLVEDARGYRFAQCDDDGNGEWIAAANPQAIAALLSRLDTAERLLGEAYDEIAEAWSNVESDYRRGKYESPEVPRAIRTFLAAKE